MHVFIHVTHLIYMCNGTSCMGRSLRMWYASCMCVTWLIRMCDITYACGMTPSHAWHALFMCDLNCSHVWHDALICVPWLVDMHVWHGLIICDMLPSYLGHATLMCVTWLMTRSYEGGDSFMCVTWLGIHSTSCPALCSRASMRVTWLIYMCGMTHSYERHAAFISGTYSAFIRVMCAVTCGTWFMHMWGRRVQVPSYVKYSFKSGK